MKRLSLALAASLAAISLAYATPGGGPNVQATGGYFSQVPMSPVSRPNNTTAYAANELVCSTSCAASQVNSLTYGPSGKLILNRVSLLKSGPSTTNASFTVYFYSSSPTLTSLSDQSGYLGPYAADFPNYLGNASCSTGNLTNDGTAQVWYECLLSNPNSSGALVLQSASTQTTYPIYGVIQANGAYTPAAQETFTVYLSGLY